MDINAIHEQMFGANPTNFFKNYITCLLQKKNVLKVLGFFFDYFKIKRNVYILLYNENFVDGWGYGVKPSMN